MIDDLVRRFCEETGLSLTAEQTDKLKKIMTDYALAACWDTQIAEEATEVGCKLHNRIM